MVLVTDFKNDIVCFIVKQTNLLIMFYDYADGEIVNPIGTGDSEMKITYRGYKHQIVFSLNDIDLDKDDAINQCIEEFYRRVIMNVHDGELKPITHKIVSDINRFKVFQQMKRDGFNNDDFEKYNLTVSKKRGSKS